MYLPFLRGKLYELKAIKEFIEEGYGTELGRHIMPIIEPVKKDIRPLLSCIDAMGKAEMPFAVVLNSKTGDYQRTVFDIPSLVKEICDMQWSPAFEVNSSANVDAIENAILEYSLNDVMLVFFTIVELEDDRIKRLVTNDAVKYIVALNLTQRISVIEDLSELGKKLISIEDCFPEKTPNNAYRGNIDEAFSDTFSYYKSRLGLFGFSDFTTLSRNFREGGVLPQVVAIHMTYQKSSRVIYVHHFLSDSRNGSNNIREEFREANIKISPFYADKPTTPAVEQIIALDYPGLGAIKKYSIKNHLELMNRILHEREDHDD